MPSPRPAPPRRPAPRRSPWWTAFVVASVMAGAFVLGAAGYLLWQRSTAAEPGLRASPAASRLDDLKGSLGRAIDRGPSRVIYLNREGAVLSGGDDDATRNRSSIVSSAGLAHASVPAFAGTPRRWEQIVNCVRAKFEPYDVQVVDQRPVTGSYVMAVIGGRPALLGDQLPVATQRITGLAPFSGEPIRDAVVMVFSRAAKESLRTVCETTSMEVAHTFGLDHARHCKDLMTYMPPCSSKRFLDKDIPCGEDENRACKGGAPTQNSHARLLALLGPRPTDPPAEPDGPVAKPTSKRTISAAPLHVAEDGHLHEH